MAAFWREMQSIVKSFSGRQGRRSSRRGRSGAGALPRVRMGRAVQSVVEHLEDRVLLASVPTPVVGVTSYVDSPNNSNTPSIAYDPTNPLKMVQVFSSVGTNSLTSYYSLNGGTTWAGFGIGNKYDPNSAAGNPQHYSTASDASVAFDRSGNVYVLYFERTADNSRGELVLQKFDFSGNVPLKLDNPVPPVVAPNATTDPNLPYATLYNWYNAFDVIYSPMLAVDNNLPAYTDPTDPTKLVVDRNSGNVYAAWATDFDIPTTYPVTYWNPNAIKMVGSVNGGATFSTEQYVNPLNYTYNPSTSAKRDGHLTAPRMTISQGTPDGGVQPGQVTVIYDDFLYSGIFSRAVTDTEAFTVAGNPVSLPDADKDAGAMSIPTTAYVDLDQLTQVDPSFNISDLDVQIALYSADLQDIKIELQSPLGQTITLVSNRVDDQGKPLPGNHGMGPGSYMGITPGALELQGSTVGGYYHTTFDDNAPRSIVDGSGSEPYIGHFRPEAGTLNSLITGRTAAQVSGVWTLTLTDAQYDGDAYIPANHPSHELYDWSLTFTGSTMAANAPRVVSTIAGSLTTPFPLKAAPSPTLGIAPAASIAADNTLGSYSAHQGRLYVTYVYGTGGEDDNTEIGMVYSDNGGTSWGGAVRVNNDWSFSDGFSGAGLAEGGFAYGRAQFQPEVAVDQSNGAVVASWYDARYDASRARVTRYVGVSIDGGANFSQTYANATNYATDEITGKGVAIGPVPDNQTIGDTTIGFGQRQGLVAVDGHAVAVWSGNSNEFGRNKEYGIHYATLLYAAGPRIISSTMGPVNEFDSVTGAPQLTGFDVTFDRYLDPLTFSKADITVIYRPPNVSGDDPGTIVPVTDVIATDALARGATAFHVTLDVDPATGLPWQRTGTYSYYIRPDLSDRYRDPYISSPVTPGSSRSYWVNPPNMDLSNGPTWQRYWPIPAATGPGGVNIDPITVPDLVGLGNTEILTNAYVDVYLRARNLAPPTGTFTFTLSTPWGQQVPLNFVGGSQAGEHYGRYVLPDPSILTGHTPDGNWTLNVACSGGGTTTVLTTWALTLDATTATYTQAVASPIPVAVTPGTAPSVTDSLLDLSAVASNVLLTDLNVQVNLTHGAVGDLDLTVISPTGVRIPLVLQGTLTGANFTNTIFDDQAAGGDPGDITKAAAPFTGTFRPASVLSDAIGVALKGTWMLEVKNYGASTGSVDNWSMLVQTASGNLMDQNANGTQGEVPVTGVTNGDYYIAPNPADPTYTDDGTQQWFRTPYTTDTLPLMIAGPRVVGTSVVANYRAPLTQLNLPIPSKGTGNSGGADDLTVSKITIQANAIVSIRDLNVLLDLTHGKDSDLIITLTHEDTGTVVVLSNGKGGSGQNFTGTVFDDQAAASIGDVSAVAPFTGSYRPEQPLSAFLGESIAGTWTLTIQDTTSTNTGKLLDWSLDIAQTQSSGAQNLVLNGAIKAMDVTFDRYMDPSSFTTASVISAFGPTGAIAGPYVIEPDPLHTDTDLVTGATRTFRVHFPAQQKTDPTLQLSGSYGITLASSITGVPYIDVKFDAPLLPADWNITYPTLTALAGSSSEIVSVVGPLGAVDPALILIQPDPQGLNGTPRISPTANFRLWFLDPSSAPAGTYTVSFSGNIVGTYTFNFVPGQKLDTNANAGVNVLRNDAGADPLNISPVKYTATAADLTAPIASGDTSELQTLTLTGTLTAGTWQIRATDYLGVVRTTAPLAFNASAATIQTALNSVLGVNAVTVTIPTSYAAGILITFGGANYRSAAQPMMQLVTTALTGITGANVTRTTVAVVGVPVDYPINIVDNFQIQSAQLGLNITYANDPDLTVELIPPASTGLNPIYLFGGVGSGVKHSNFTDTLFDPDPTLTGIDRGSAPFFGKFHPQDPPSVPVLPWSRLSDLPGQWTRGVWTLRIISKTGTTGTLNGWFLNFGKAPVTDGLGQPISDQVTVRARIFTQDQTDDLSHNAWTPIGPAANDYGDNAGQVNAITVDPSDPSGNTVFVGGASGGVWKTTNFLTTDSNGPTYMPLTMFGPTGSQNIGSIAIFGRNKDPQQSVVFAATGQAYSSTLNAQSTGGVGFLRSMDGGLTWTLLDSTTNVDANGQLLPLAQRDHRFVGTCINKVLVDPRALPDGNIIVYAAITDPTPAGRGGVWRSVDGGATWTQMRAGDATDVVIDLASGYFDALNNPGGNVQIIYAAFRGDGVYMSPNRGRVWNLMAGGVGNPLIQDWNRGSRPVPVSTFSTPNTITGSTKGRIVLAKPLPTGDKIKDTLYQGWLYAAAANPDGSFNGLYMTKDFGQNWTEVRLPATATGSSIPTNDAGNLADYSITGALANYDFTIAVDPTNPNIVYLGGNDRSGLNLGGLIRVDTTLVADAHALIMPDDRSADGPSAHNSDADPIQLYDLPNIPHGDGAALKPWIMNQQYLNLLQYPGTIYYHDSTFTIDSVDHFSNSGSGARWTQFGNQVIPGAGTVMDRFDRGLTAGFGWSHDYYHTVITMVDALTGKTRVIFGTDQGVFSAVDAGDGSMYAGTGNDIAPTGPRNGNLQLNQVEQGAVQPSDLAAQIAGSMFYVNANLNGFPASSPVLLDTGVLNWTNADPAKWFYAYGGYNSTFGPYRGTGYGVSTDQQGKGIVYRYVEPIEYSRTDFFQVYDPNQTIDFVSRTFGLMQSSTGGVETSDPQWGNNFNAQFAVNPVNSDQIIIGSSTQLFGTENQGRFWNVIATASALGNATPVAMAYGAPDPNGPGGHDATNFFIYAGTDAGSIYVTFTGGGGGANNAWTNLSAGLDGSAIQKIVTDPIRGSHDAYAVTRSGVYYMADATAAGARWVNITSNLFQLTHNSFSNSALQEVRLAASSLSSIQADWRYVIPDANNITHPVLYVAGDGGVFRSMDNGLTWTPFPDMTHDASAADGGFLPTAKVTDLDIATGNIDPTTGMPMAVDPNTGSRSRNLLMASTWGSGAYIIRMSPLVVPGTFTLNHDAISDTGVVGDPRGNIDGITNATDTIDPNNPDLSLAIFSGRSQQSAFGNKVYITLLDMTDPANPTYIGGFTGNFGDGSDIDRNTTDAFGAFHIAINADVYTAAKGNGGFKVIGVRATDDAGTVGPIVTTESDPNVVENPALPSNKVYFALSAPAAGPAIDVQAVENAVFTGAVANFTADSSGCVASIDWGDGSAPTVGVVTKLNPADPVDRNYYVTGTHTYKQESDTTTPVPFIVTVTVTDPAANVGIITNNVTVADPAVVGGIGQSFSGAEGVSSGDVIVATFTDPGFDPAVELVTDEHYNVTINWGDGTPDSSGASVKTTFNAATGVFSVMANHVYNDDGLFNVTTHVQHDYAPNTDIVNSLTIYNVPPVPTLSGPNQVLAGSTASFTLSTYDQSPADQIAGFTYSINWGDGTPVQTIAKTPGDGAAHAITHVFANPGSYHVVVTAYDDAVAPAYAGATAVDVTVKSPTSADAFEGATTGTITLATFAYAGNNPANPEPASNYSASIDWRDGTAPTTGVVSFDAIKQVYVVKGSHTYADNGTYQIRTTIVHAGRPNVVIDNAFVVANVNPIVAIAGPAIGTATAPTYFSIAGNDQGTTDRAAGFVYTVAWGNGVVENIARTPNNGTPFYYTHTYARAGAYHVVITSTDKDGGVSASKATDITIRTPTYVDRPAINSGYPTRSLIQTISFYPTYLGHAPASLSLANLTLLRNGYQVVPLTAAQLTYSGGKATLNLRNVTLQDGDYQLQTSLGAGTPAIVDFYKLTGDVNGDRMVDNTDLNIVAHSLYYSVGQPGYSFNADVNDDGKVDSTDVGIVNGNMGVKLLAAQRQYLSVSNKAFITLPDLDFGYVQTNTSYRVYELVLTNSGSTGTLLFRNLSIADPTATFTYAVVGQAWSSPAREFALNPGQSVTIRIYASPKTSAVPVSAKLNVFYSFTNGASFGLASSTIKALGY